MTEKTFLKRALGLKCEAGVNKGGYKVQLFTYQGRTYEFTARGTKVPTGEYSGFYDENGEYMGFEVYKADGGCRISLVGNGKFLVKQVFSTWDDGIEWFAKQFGRAPLYKMKKFGVYCYIDDLGDIIYIGKDSNINLSQRHYNHLERNEQEIDKVANDSTYLVLATVETKEEMDKLESELIRILKPRYNLIGGKRNYEKF